MKNLMIAVLLIALAGVTTWHLLGRQTQPAPTAPMTVAAKPDHGAIEALQRAVEEKDREIAKLRRELTEAMAKVRELKTVVEHQQPAAVAISSAPVPLSIEPVPVDASSQSNVMSRVLGNPSFSNMVSRAIAHQPRRIKDRYGPFVQQLGLGDQDAKSLYALLRERPQVFRSGSPDAESVIKVGGSESGTADEAALLALLGKDGYRDLDAYEKTLPARDEMARFDSQLKAKGLSLNDNQRDRMMDLFLATGDANNTGSLSVSVAPGERLGDATSRAVDNFIPGWDALVQGARTVLDQNQQAELDSFLGERLAAREEQADMLRSMLSEIIPDGQPADASVQATHSTGQIVTDGQPSDATIQTTQITRQDSVSGMGLSIMGMTGTLATGTVDNVTAAP